MPTFLPDEMAQTVVADLLPEYQFLIFNLENHSIPAGECQINCRGILNREQIRENGLQQFFIHAG